METFGSKENSMELLQVLLIIGISVNVTFIFITLVDKFSKFTIISKSDLGRYNTTVENYDVLKKGLQDVSGRL